MRVEQRLKVLGTVLLVWLALLAMVVIEDNQQNRIITTTLAAAGDLRMLSQRLAKAASLAIQGQAAAFRQLAEDEQTFHRLHGRLSAGGDIDGVTLPPPSPPFSAPIQHLASAWEPLVPPIRSILAEAEALRVLGEAVTRINNDNAELLELSEQLAALMLQTARPAPEVAAANQLVMLTQRMAKNAAILSSSDTPPPEVVFLLGKDRQAFRNLLQTLETPGAPTHSEEKRRRLSAHFVTVDRAIADILARLQSLSRAHRAGHTLVAGSDTLLAASDALIATSRQVLAERQFFISLLVLLGSLALITLGLMAKVYLDDVRHRAALAEAARAQAAEENRQTQEAILHLLDDISTLADGDLTVRAKVTENFTGALADAINLTADALSQLVGSVQSAANGLAQSTLRARRDTHELLSATPQQTPAHTALDGLNQEMETLTALAGELTHSVAGFKTSRDTPP